MKVVQEAESEWGSLTVSESCDIQSQLIVCVQHAIAQWPTVPPQPTVLILAVSLFSSIIYSCAVFFRSGVIGFLLCARF